MKTVIHQIKTLGTRLDGMSYVIECDDGSLIVVDGGMDEDGEELYRYLKKLSGGSDPVVELWILTHAHADHYNAFMALAEAHYKEITVRKLMFRFQPRSFFETIQPAVLPELDRLERVIPLLSGVEVLAPSAGDRLQYGSTVLEILYTAADLPPLETAVIRQSTNDGSLIFRVCAEGQTVLFLADLMEAGNDVMIKRYGKSLKSDVCQAAHHGGWSSIPAFYDLVDPEIVLIPASEKTFRRGIPYADGCFHLLNRLHVKDVIMAEQGTRRLEMPIRASVAPFFPDCGFADREAVPQAFLKKASSEPELSPSDPRWEESAVYSLAPVKDPSREGVGSARILWQEDALFLRFEANCRFYPCDKDCISTAKSNNLRVFLSEGVSTRRFDRWNRFKEEDGFIDYLKFYPEEKSFPQGRSFCSREDLCQYRVVADGEHFSLCARIPFVRAHHKGELIGLNLELTAVDETLSQRRVWEALQRGVNAERCGMEPSALFYFSLE